jgi:hypothetical protein
VRIRLACMRAYGILDLATERQWRGIHQFTPPTR